MTDLGALALAVGIAVAAWLHRPVRDWSYETDGLASGFERGMKALARAIRFQAKVRGGIIREPEPEEAPRPAEMAVYDTWIDANIDDPRERDDFRGMYEALHGLREAAPGVLDKYRRRLHFRGAPQPGQIAPTPLGVS